MLLLLLTAMPSSLFGQETEGVVERDRMEQQILKTPEEQIAVLRDSVKLLQDRYSTLVRLESVQLAMVMEDRAKLDSLAKEVDNGMDHAKELLRLQKENETLRKIMKQYVVAIDDLQTKNISLSQSLDNTSTSLNKLLQENQQDQQYFHVEVLQNDKVLPKVNDTIYLDEGEFTFRVSLYKDVKGIEVSASFDKYFYDFPADSNIYKCGDLMTLNDCGFVAIKTGADYVFNQDKSLSVGGEHLQSYWNYDTTHSEHDFDENIIVTEDIIIGERLVKSIYDNEARLQRKQGYKYPVQQLSQDIYMVFGHSYYEKGMENPQELKREKFILHVRE